MAQICLVLLIVLALFQAVSGEPEPLHFRSGALSMEPYAAFFYQYDDNIYLSPRKDNIEDSLFLLVPGIKARLSTNGTFFEVDYKAIFKQYNQHPKQDDIEDDLKGTIRFSLNPYYIAVQDNYLESSQPADIEKTGLHPRAQNSLKVFFARDAIDFKLNIGLGSGFVKYDEKVLDLLNRLENSAYAHADFEVSRSTYLLMWYDFVNLNYKDVQSRDNEYHQIFLGLSSKNLNGMSGKALVGFHRRKYENDQDTIRETFFDLSFKMPTAYGFSMSLQSKRKIVESDYADYYIQTTAGADLIQSINKQHKLSAGLMVYWNYYPAFQVESRRDTAYDLHLKLSIGIQQWLKITSEYKYLVKDSTQGVEYEFIDNRLTFGVVVSFKESG